MLLLVWVAGGTVGAERSVAAIGTGILGLGIGFAYWWSYFDFVGARRVRSGRGALSRRLLGHLPGTMSIAGTGALMVAFINQIADRRAPATAAILLSLSVALGVVALVVIAASIREWET